MASPSSFFSLEDRFTFYSACAFDFFFSAGQPAFVHLIFFAATSLVVLPTAVTVLDSSLFFNMTTDAPAVECSKNQWALISVFAS